MKRNILACCCVFLLTSVVHAEETTEASIQPATETAPEVTRLTTLDIMAILVREGVLSQQRADELLQSVAAEKSAQQIAKDKNANQQSELKARIVRVPYVPDFIKDQIRDEVRLGLREDVVNDVIGQAEHERWGIPDALPSWVNRISFKGDFRLRYQGDYFSDANADTGNIYQNLYFDPGSVNESGVAGIDQLKNISEDRSRLRSRLRLAINAKATQGVDIGMRLTTGKAGDPVSTNQTMGNGFKPYSLQLDRAFLKATAEYKEWTFWGGRMPNPWISTDLLWDSDLNFDGLAFQYRPLQSDDMDNDERVFDTSITLGVFPLEEVELSSQDKWLLGFQLGLSWKFLNQDRLDIGLAYYDYKNITGVRNEQGSNLNDYTAPVFMQQGNSLYNIANPLDPNSTAQLWALAADYNLVDIVVAYRLANFAPVNITLKADYVKNIGYDANDVAATTGNVFETPRQCIDLECSEIDTRERVTGYQLMLQVGWPSLKQRGNWDAGIAYKYLERDAVLDAYTDSDFHNGGTDAKGWSVNGRYAVDDNVWMSLKLISTDEIDGAPYGVDTLQLDLIASF